MTAYYHGATDIIINNEQLLKNQRIILMLETFLHDTSLL